MEAVIRILVFALVVYGNKAAIIGNVARNKKASLSGGQEANLAVDVEGPDQTCAQITRQGTHAWWMVELGQLHNISNVTVTGPSGEPLEKLGILIGNSSKRSANTVPCSLIESTSFYSASNVTFTCGRDSVATRVLVEYSRYLHTNHTLCDVEVIGSPFVDCSSCRGNSSCNETQGCDQCPDRFKLPYCSECLDGFEGPNCCSEHCRNKACDTETGECTEGCFHESWNGRKCDIRITKIQFGNDDIVNTTPSRITNTSVTWSWKEGTIISEEAAPYIGYRVNYRQPRSTDWILGTDVPYMNTDWQQGTVALLQPNTFYEFDIKAYRKTFAGGITNRHTRSYVTSGHEALLARTSGVRPTAGGIPFQLTTTAAPVEGKGSTERPHAAISFTVIFLLLALAAATCLFVSRLGKGEAPKEKAHSESLPNSQEGHLETTINTRGSEENVVHPHGHQLDRTPNEAAEPKGGPTKKRNIIIKLEELASYIDEKNLDQGFKQEFIGISSHVLLDCIATDLPENSLKNRFRNIKAYDSTRVVLDLDDEGSDYINANYISGYKEQKKTYVAAQAPTQNTEVDFWRMIWQLKSNRIVMLTKTLENCRRKSQQYWPERVGEEKTFGDMTIKTMKRYQLTDYVFSLLNIHKGDESRTVRHLQFIRWPDKSAPEHAYPLLAFRRKVRSLDNVSRGPMIVHCSAGIGRTGTFIALDNLLQQAKAESQIDVVTLVNQMRKERMNMIQTVDQYKFVYTAMLEAINVGDTTIPVVEVKHKVDALLLEDQTGTSPLQNQFKIIQGLKSERSVDDAEGREEEHVDKNRSVDIIPDDRMRPTLMTAGENESSYINAVFVDNFRDERGSIVTQMPLPNTVGDFWRLVYQYRRKTIIMLNPLDKYDEQCTVYWPFEEEPGQIHGDIEIKFLSSDSNESLITRMFQINKRHEEPMIVKQFQLMDWAIKDDLPNLGSLLDLVDYMHRLGNDTEVGSVLVHCLDGATRSGLLCAADYMIKKMKADEEVDIFLAVRCVSNNRPQFVNTVSQYKFLHELAREYISLYGINRNM